MPQNDPSPSPPSKPKRLSDGPFMHYCHCGAWGLFGYNVAIIKYGRTGEWYCAEHRPDQPKVPDTLPPF